MPHLDLLLRASFDLDALPDWPCPLCGRGVLRRPVDGVPQRLVFGPHYSGHGLAAALGATWLGPSEPESVDGWTLVELVCTELECRATAVLFGMTGEEEYGRPADGSGGDQVEWWVNHIVHPVLIDPAPSFIRVPVGVGDSVLSELEAAFRILRMDRAAAAVHIRVALERWLDSREVRAAGRLGDRIEGDLPESLQGHRDALRVLKWLGDDGAHGNCDASLEDVRAALSALEELFLSVHLQVETTNEYVARQRRRRRGRKG